MFTVLTSFTLTHEVKNDLYTITGYFNHSFQSKVNKRISKKKRKFLFPYFTYRKVTFNGFFVLEVVLLFEKMIDESTPTSSLNVKDLQLIVNRLKNETWLKDHYDIINNKEVKETLDIKNVEKMMTWKILPHQVKAFTFYNKVKQRADLKGGFLDAAVGSGKTFTSLALAESLNSNKIIIVVQKQASEKPWVDTMEGDLYKEKQSYFTSTRKEAKYYKNERIIIIHYESIKKFREIVNKLKGGKVTLIVDEYHNFNEVNSGRSTELHKFSKELNPTDTILMTGTSIKAKAVEYAAMLRLLDNKFNAHVEKKFLNLYKSPSAFLIETLPFRFNGIRVKITKEGLPIPPTIPDYLDITLSNVEEYTLESISKAMKIYMKEKENEYLPFVYKYTNTYNKYVEISSIKLMDNRDLTLTELNNYKKDIETIIFNYKNNTLRNIPDILKRVNEFEKFLESEIDPSNRKEFREAKTIHKYLKLKIRGMVLANVVMRSRINAFKDIAKEIDYLPIINSTKYKTVIFSNYIEVLEVVDSKLKDLNTLKVFGKHTGNLSSTVDMFTKIKKYNPLIASIKSLGVGVPLISANVSVVIDKPFRSHDLIQLLARTARLGQPADKCYVLYTNLVSDEPTIVSRGSDIIEWSKNQVESLTGDKVDLDLTREVVLEDHNYTDKEIEEFFEKESEIEEKEKKEIILDW